MKKCKFLMRDKDVMLSAASVRPRFSASAANAKKLLPVPMKLISRTATGSASLAGWATANAGGCARSAFTPASKVGAKTDHPDVLVKTYND